MEILFVFYKNILRSYQLLGPCGRTAENLWRIRSPDHSWHRCVEAAPKRAASQTGATQAGRIHRRQPCHERAVSKLERAPIRPRRGFAELREPQRLQTR